MNRKRKVEDTPEDILNTLSSTDTIYVEENAVSNTYNIYLNDDIGKPSLYTEVFTILKTATEIDMIVFHINNSGGYLDTFIEFYHFIKNTEAHTTAIVYNAHSAAAFIAFSCDEIELAEFCTLFIHNASGGYNGKTDDHREYSKNFDEQMKSIMNTLLRGFLTDNEIEKVLEGKSFWFTKKEIEKRFDKMKRAKK